MLDQNLSTADRHNSSVEPLPLFRPEAIVAQQQKFYGEIILIRPFSLMLLSWFAIGVTAAVMGFLLLGHYTEQAHVSGVVAGSPVTGPHASAEKLEASFFVPEQLISRLHPGSQLTLRCTVCSASFSQQVGTVLAIPNVPLRQEELSQINLPLAGSVYKVTVLLPLQTARISELNLSSQAGTRMEADIPLGRKPLIKWFFERSES